MSHPRAARLLLTVAVLVAAGCSGGSSAPGPGLAAAGSSPAVADDPDSIATDQVGSPAAPAAQVEQGLGPDPGSRIGPPTTSAPDGAPPVDPDATPPTPEGTLAGNPGSGEGLDPEGSPTSTAAPTTTASGPPDDAPSTVVGDPTNPIAVPIDLLAGAATTGPARCIRVDLHQVPVPPNPGYRGEELDGQVIGGDDLWAITFYLMLYANCERQVRGLQPFSTYPVAQQLAMQETVLGIDEPHGRFGERVDIAGGLAAEGHGGGPLTGEPIDHDVGEDDDGDGRWSASEIGRRSVSGNQLNGNVGLVDHGDAMIDETYSCIFAAASLGGSADHRVDVIIFYGNRC